MKANFFTGLILLLPLTITIIIVMLLINLLTAPFYGFVNLSYPLLSKLFILIGLAGFTLLLGFLGYWFFEHYFVRLTNLLFHRIPVFNHIYKSIRDIMNTFFSTKSTGMKGSARVAFTEGSEILSIISQDKLAEGSSPELADYSVILMLQTPNPTVGYVMLYKKEDQTEMDVKVHEAIKFIVSCGINLPPSMKPEA